MTKPYFYTDPLAAAWMAKHHGMRFVSSYSGKEFDETLYVFNAGSPVEAVRDGQLYVVHPDSRHLLEPRLGDILHKAKSGQSLTDLRSVDGDDEFDRQINARLIERGYCIIQRNGLVFHWPDGEVA